MTARTEWRCHPPNVPPPPRDAVTIAHGLADAAEYLDTLAHRIHALGDDTGEPETAELDALAVGLHRAATELRMHCRKEAAPCHD